MKIVNVCDEEVFGKVLREGNLEVAISEEYFFGFRVDDDGAIQLVREAEIANLVGNRIVDLVIKKGLAHPGAVRKIQDVSFLMIYKFAHR